MTKLRQVTRTRLLDVAVAYLRCGSVKAAAHEVGLREQTAKNYLAMLREELGVSTIAQVVWILRKEIEARDDAPA